MSTRDRIVRATGELLRRQGYAATGMGQVAKAAQAPIGSLYHHFRGGKREIAAAVLRETGAAYIELLPLLLDAYDDLPAGVAAAFATAADDMESNGWINLCPVATVTAEIADVEPDLREVAADVLAGWVETGTAYFVRRGLAPDHARELVHAVLAALEGGFLMARGLRSKEPLLAAGRAVASYAATTVAGERV